MWHEPPAEREIIERLIAGEYPATLFAATVEPLRFDRWVRIHTTGSRGPQSNYYNLWGAVAEYLRKVSCDPNYHPKDVFQQLSRDLPCHDVAPIDPVRDVANRRMVADLGRDEVYYIRDSTHLLRDIFVRHGIRPWRDLARFCAPPDVDRWSTLLMLSTSSPEPYERFVRLIMVEQRDLAATNASTAITHRKRNTTRHL